MQMCQDELVDCLGDVPVENAKPTDCRLFGKQLLANCKPPPCANAMGKKYCAAAARIMLRWCRGLPYDPGFTTTWNETALWVSPPSSLTVGDTISFVVRTNSTDVARVQFWILRPDLDPEDPASFFPVGMGTGVAQTGNQKQWTLQVDSRQWGLEGYETTLTIWAESQSVNGGVSTPIDISDPIDLELTHP